MVRKNWFSGVSRDSSGLNFFGWTKKGNRSKKMVGKIYNKGKIGGVKQKPRRFSDGSLWFIDETWETGPINIRKRK